MCGFRVDLVPSHTKAASPRRLLGGIRSGVFAWSRHLRAVDTARRKALHSADIDVRKTAEPPSCVAQRLRHARLRARKGRSCYGLALPGSPPGSTGVSSILT